MNNFTQGLGMKNGFLKRFVVAVYAAGLAIGSIGAAYAQSAPANSASAPSVPGQSLGIPMGTGAGEHGANSPFAPLQPRADVVPWSVLTDVKTKTVKNRILPVFGSVQQGLSQKTQRVQGFMMPLDPGEKQHHFLISSVPLTCAFCLPGGPESMVEVTTKTPVRYSMEPVVVEGKFAVLADDPYGMYYRMTDAVAVK
jgi:hypothetical protein